MKQPNESRLKVKKMLTSSVIGWHHYYLFCKREMSKYPKIWGKQLILKKVVLISCERIEDFNEMFWKYVAFNSIKCPKREGLHPSIKNTF